MDINIEKNIIKKIYKNGGFPPLKYCENIITKTGKKERFYVAPLYTTNKLLETNNNKFFNIDDDNIEIINDL